MLNLPADKQQVLPKYEEIYTFSTNNPHLSA